MVLIETNLKRKYKNVRAIAYLAAINSYIRTTNISVHKCVRKKGEKL